MPPAGFAAQLAAATAHGPPAPDTSGAVSEVAPWPNYLTVEGLRNVAGTHNVDRQDPPVVHVLPGDTQEMVAACSSSALPLHVCIPDRLKAKIWAGEYVGLALLLHDNFAQPQDDALSVQSAGDGQGPTLCLSCVVRNITTCTVLLCRNVGSGSIVSRRLCMRLSHRLGMCYRVHISYS